VPGRGLALKSESLIEASRQILEEIHPSTVRGVCYQLFTRGLIASMGAKDVPTVLRLLVIARENGRIPWHHIVDIMVIDKPITESRPLVLGLRLLSELGHRVRELESRHRPSPREQRELADLKELRQKEDGHDRSRPSPAGADGNRDVVGRS
jgi:hypothetical protein